MKNFILLSFISAFLFSCSSDDDGGGTIDQNDYFPVTANALWFYDYSRTNQGSTNTGNTVVDINGSEVIQGETYQILDNTTYLVGAMNQIFFKKSLSKEVIIRPAVDFMGSFADFGDMNFIMNSMQTGNVLFETEKEIVGDNTTIPANENNIIGTVTPHTFITIKNRHVGKINSMNVNSINYEAITHQRMEYEIKMVLSINATIVVAGETIPFNRDHELVAKQPYGKLNLFLAKDVGIIKTDYDYSFSNVTLDTSINFGGVSIDINDFAPEIMNFNNALNMRGHSSINDFSF